MKWILLLSFVLPIIPLSSWLRRNPAKQAVVWVAFGFLVIQHSPLHLFLAPLSWATWPGYVKGAELSIVDALAFAIYLSQPPARTSFPFKLGAVSYLLAVLASVFQAEFAEPTLFYAWQTGRVLFVALVISRSAAGNGDIVAPLLRGMAYGILIALVPAAWERFAHGAIQATGPFAHQNTFGLISHFVTFPFLAMLLGGSPGRLPAIVPIAGAMIAILTGSRATIVLTGIGCVLLFVSSALRGWSPRKAKAATIGIIAAAVLAPIAVSSLETRLGDQAIFGADEEREAFEKAAAMMVADHPMGVGANYYVVVANAEGYSDRAGVIPTKGSRGANVHNVYWLVLAETGYIGLAAFVLVLAHPLLTSFRTGWRHARDPSGELLLGLGITLLVVCLHSSLEWTLLTFQVQYPLWVTIGLIAGLAQPLNNRAQSVRGIVANSVVSQLPAGRGVSPPQSAGQRAAGRLRPG